MRGDIVLAGFVLTAEEWEGLDTLARAQLLRDVPRAAPPARLAAGTTPPRRREVEDPYEVYELVAPPR